MNCVTYPSIMSIANTQPHMAPGIIQEGAAAALSGRRQSDTPSTSTTASNSAKVTLPPISSIISSQQTSPRVPVDCTDDERSSSLLRASQAMKQSSANVSSLGQTPRKLSSTQLSVQSQLPATAVSPVLNTTPAVTQQTGSVPASRAMSQVSSNWRPQALPSSNHDNTNYYAQPSGIPTSVPPSVGTAPATFTQSSGGNTPTQTPSGSPNANYSGVSGQSAVDTEAAILQHHNIMLQQQQIQQHIMHQQQIQQHQQQGYYYVVAPMPQQQQQQQQMQQMQQIPMAIPQGRPQMIYQPAQAMPQMAMQPQPQQQQPQQQQPQQQQQQMQPYPIVLSTPNQNDLQQRMIPPQPQPQPQQVQMMGQPMQAVEYENNGIVYQMAPRPDMMQPGQPIMIQPNGMPAGAVPGLPTGGLVPPHQAIKAGVETGYIQTEQGMIPVPTSIQSNLSLAVRLRKQCPVCGKICSRPSTLKTHYLIHTGDTPFKCPWKTCKKSFNVKSNMLRHLKSHQKKSQMPEEDHTYVSDSEKPDEPKVKEEAIAKEIEAAAATATATAPAPAPAPASESSDSKTQ